MEEEIWKDIGGYEGLYQVSNLGRVRSLDRMVGDRWGGKRLYKGKIMKTPLNSDGYCCVDLCKENKRKTYRVNRLVAIAFIKNDDPINKIFVNHKDEDRANNYANNLEWCTPEYNSNYGTKTQRIIESEWWNKNNRNMGKKVVLKSNSKLILFPSLMEASRKTGITRGTIKYRLGKTGSGWFYLKRYKNNVRLKSQ